MKNCSSLKVGALGISTLGLILTLLSLIVAPTRRTYADVPALDDAEGGNSLFLPVIHR